MDNLKRIRFKDRWMQESFDRLLKIYEFFSEQVDQQMRLLKELSETDRYRDKVKQYREGKPKYMMEGIEEKGPQIIMLRTIDAKPMDPEEARMQLGASGDGFIIFRDIERGNVCVMYKRKDGNFGLIETTGRAL